jgi:predicted DNA-binding transcriptional regulator AlpA
MSEPPVIITTAQVAELLGIQPSTFLARVGELRQHHAFPAAIPCSGGRRYSRAQILAWIERGPAPAPPITSTPDQDVAACEDILLQRAHAMMAVG